MLAVGLKLTLRLQFLPAASEAGQLPRAAVNGAPEVDTDVISNAPGPLFVSLTLAVVVVLIRFVPKALACSAATGSGVTPFPVRLTMLGEPAALCAMDTVAVFAPMVVGANRTVTVHEPPGATVVQVVAEVNWFALVPARVTPETTRFAVPVFVTVMVCGPDVVPVAWLPNPSEPGETEATGTGAVAVPLNATAVGDDAALCTMLTEA